MADGAGMSLFERIGVDVGGRLALEDAVAWAAANRVRFIDVQLDGGANALATIDDRRGERVRELCRRHAVRLGLHTSSAVNVAETAPFVGDAVERYLEAYVDAAARLGAEWIVVHAGFHFTADRDARMQAGRERLRRLVAYAEGHGAMLLLENLNKEPAAAEVRYLAHTLDEWRFYFEHIVSPALALSFTANHAHLVPDGIPGFIAGLDMARVREVRLADCFRGGHEEHLRPGEGDIDFAALFRRVEDAGFRGHYMNAFGSLDDMLRGRDDLLRLASPAGIAGA